MIRFSSPCLLMCILVRDGGERIEGSTALAVWDPVKGTGALLYTDFIKKIFLAALFLFEVRNPLLAQFNVLNKLEYRLLPHTRVMKPPAVLTNASMSSCCPATLIVTGISISLHCGLQVFITTALEITYLTFILTEMYRFTVFMVLSFFLSYQVDIHQDPRLDSSLQ